MNNSAPKQGPNTMSYSAPSAVNPMVTESPYIPSSESTTSGRSYSPDHPGERVADSSVMPLAMQYVNHSNMSTTGYAYAEHGRSQVHGLTDVDVDEKPHLVYESMTELQHQRQRMQMNGGNVKANLETGEKYAYVPNRANSCNRAMCYVIKVIWNLFLLILVFGAFSLSVYNFINKTEPTVAPVTEPGQLTGAGGGDNASAKIEQLNATVMELKAMLDQLSATHQQHYQQVNNTIFAAVESVQNVSPTNNLDLTVGCVDNVAECLINHEDAGSTTPSSAGCETSPLPVSVSGMSNVNIYCNVDNAVQEANPLVATLNIYDGAITCICNIVAITVPSGSPACKLHVHRCPSTIRLNTTMP